MHDDLMREITDLSRDLPFDALEPICRDLETMPSDLDASGVMTSLKPIPLAQVNHRVKALIQSWKNVAPGLPPIAIAAAIRASHEASTRAMGSGLLELVWTGPAARPARMRRTEQALVETIRSAERELWFVCFSAFRVTSIKEALGDAVDRGVMVRFVAEDPDESGGRIDHSVSNALGQDLEGRLQVLVWPKQRRILGQDDRTGVLHVKCALADDRKLFVTSANLSGSAMHLNMELGLLVDGGSTPKQMADHLHWLVSSKTLVPAEDCSTQFNHQI